MEEQEAKTGVARISVRSERQLMPEDAAWLQGPPPTLATVTGALLMRNTLKCCPSGHTFAYHKTARVTEPVQLTCCFDRSDTTEIQQVKLFV